MKKFGPSYLWLVSLAVPAAVFATSACSGSAAAPTSTGGTSSTGTGGFAPSTGGTGTGVGTGGTSSTTGGISTGTTGGTSTGTTGGTSTGTTGGTSTGTTGGTSTGTTGGTSTGTTGGTSTAGTTSSTGGVGGSTAGSSATGGSGGAVAKVKLCATKTTLTVPLMTNFDSYDGKTAIDSWGFPFNGAATDPGVLYAGPYSYNDGTGTPFTGMVGGANSSTFALSISNTMATGWGGGVGFWMACVNASAYAGVSFYARGTAVPTGKASVSLTMEQTSAPDATDPAGGGTCDAAAMCKSPQVEVPVTADWTLIKIPWSMFTAGVGSGMAAVTPTGDGIAGLSFQVGMLYMESPAGSGTYVPTPGPYDFQLDDLGFY